MGCAGRRREQRRFGAAFGLALLCAAIGCKDALLNPLRDAAADMDAGDVEMLGPPPSSVRTQGALNQLQVAPVTGEHFVFIPNPFNGELNIIPFATTAVDAGMSAGPGSAAPRSKRPSVLAQRVRALISIPTPAASADLALAIVDAAGTDRKVALIDSAKLIVASGDAVPGADTIQRVTDATCETKVCRAVIYTAADPRDEATVVSIDFTTPSVQLASVRVATTGKIERAYVDAAGRVFLVTANGIEVWTDGSHATPIARTKGWDATRLQVAISDTTDSATAGNIAAVAIFNARERVISIAADDAAHHFDVRPACQLPSTAIPTSDAGAGADDAGADDAGSATEAPAIVEPPIDAIALARTKEGALRILALSGDALFSFGIDCGDPKQVSLSGRGSEHFSSIVGNGQHFALIAKTKLALGEVCVECSEQSLKYLDLGSPITNAIYLPRQEAWFVSHADAAGCSLVGANLVDSLEPTPLLSNTTCSAPMDSLYGVVTTTSNDDSGRLPEIVRARKSGTRDSAKLEDPIWASGINRSGSTAFAALAPGDIVFMDVQNLKQVGTSAIDISASARQVYPDGGHQ